LFDLNALRQERAAIYEDLFNNRIPKRVPVSIALPFEPIAQYGGLDLAVAQWDPALVDEAADKICQVLFSDSCPFTGSLRFPSYYQALQSQSFVMGSGGFIQHPEVVGMLPEEYDYLIEKPFDCLLERILPRQYKALRLDEPFSMAINFTKSMLCYQHDMAQAGAIVAKLKEKYGYYAGADRRAGGLTSAPFDFLADQLRGFKGISMDVRRMPEKVAAACEALYPIVLKKGMPATVSNSAAVFIPLHMPTFMREQDFAKLWWPSFKKMIDEYASLGVHCQLFCEDNWNRYLDYLYELPVDTRLMFEYGDARLIKEKLGRKHIITGLYPVTMLKTHTREQCLDKAKEMLDVLAPGGKYFFNLDKNPLTIKDIKLENLCAVTEYIRDHSAYSNAGETAGMAFNKDDYRVDPAAARKLESKYYRTWEDYKAQNPQVSDLGRLKLQGFEEMIFQYLVFLLV